MRLLTCYVLHRPLVKLKGRRMDESFTALLESKNAKLNLLRLSHARGLPISFQSQFFSIVYVTRMYAFVLAWYKLRWTITASESN